MALLLTEQLAQLGITQNMYDKKNQEYRIDKMKSNIKLTILIK